MIAEKCCLSCLLLTLLISWSGIAGAQTLTQPRKRPSDTPLELPAYESPGEQVPLTLPPVTKPRHDGDLSKQLKIYVEKFQLTGNTVFTSEELHELIQPYEKRAITPADLQEVRYILTRHYVEHGYINSGAVIPDQTILHNTITIKIVEGVLNEINITGNERLSSDYLGQRIMLGAGPPLSIVKLGERLQIMQQSPRIERLNAALEPGARPGESVLKIKVTEAPPFQLWAGIDNHQSPAVGGEQGRVWGLHQNLTGHGDTLRFEYDKAEGLDDWFASYAIPLNARDTTLGLFYDNLDAEVVEEPFDELDIERENETFGISLTQPFHLSVNRIFSLGLSLELRKSESFLLGERFPFTPGTDDGKTKLSIIRFSQEWQDRGRNHVLAARSMISKGFDAFGATTNGEPQDGDFVSWLGQFQWAHRIAQTNSQFIFRADAQAANDSLPPMEQFSVGGADTVRGYRETRLLADTGVIASVEVRIPVFTSKTGEIHVQLAPFVDYGQVKNRFRPDPIMDHISSVGLGLLGNIGKRINFDIYYGHAFQDFDKPDDDLQDDGVNFSVTAQLF